MDPGDRPRLRVLLDRFALLEDDRESWRVATRFPRFCFWWCAARSGRATIRPDAPALVAIDGKTLRASLDRGAGRAALHLVSAFATREKLVLAQEAVAAAGAFPARIASPGWPRLPG
jgi:hypothetical protein